MYKGIEAHPDIIRGELDLSAPASADFFKNQTPKTRRHIEVPSYRGLIPYPIIPSENFPDNPVNEDIFNPVVSRHHEIFLYGRQVFNSLGGLATRVSRVALTEPQVHNGRGGLHTHFEMSPGPRDDAGRAKALILSDAGFYPDIGIDLWSGSPEIRPIEDGEFEILRRIDPANQNRYQNLHVDTAPFRAFYDHFLLKQPFLNASYGDIERFAAYEKFKSVRELGQILLQDLIDSALRDFRSEYEDLREGEKLHPNAPIDPAELIYRALGDDELRDRRLFYKIRRKAIGYITLADSPAKSKLEMDMAPVAQAA